MKKLILLLCVGLNKEIQVNSERIHRLRPEVARFNQTYNSLNCILAVFFLVPLSRGRKKRQNSITSLIVQTAVHKPE